MTFISYSQNFEDVMLWRALKHIESGYYVDVGAGDPTELSVTKSFYDNNWHGINIEPAFLYYSRLCKDRPLDINLPIAVGAVEDDLTFHEISNSGLSTLDPSVAEFQKKAGWQVVDRIIHVLPLTVIFEKYVQGEIHFLKIDVEGYEAEVLKGLNLFHWRPWIILIEAKKPSSIEDHYDSWESLVLESRYNFVYYDGINRFYVAQEHSELIPSLQIPPNLYDDFITLRELRQQEFAMQQVTVIRKQETYVALILSQLKQVSSEFQSVQAHLNKVINEKQELVTKLDASHIQNQKLIEQKENIQFELTKVYQSRSYRITAPLRAIFGTARIQRDNIIRFSGRVIRNNTNSLEPFIHRQILQLRHAAWFTWSKNKLKKHFPNIWYGLRRALLPSYTPASSITRIDPSDPASSNHAVGLSEEEKHFYDLFINELSSPRNRSNGGE